MAKDSSAKKIERVQRAGVSKHPGQRRALAFPLAIGAIVVFGTLGVFLARDARMNFTGAQPRTGGADSWVSAYNVYLCDTYSNPKWANKADTTSLGIDTKEDGLIRISPTSPQAAGDKAVFGLFADRVGLKLTPNSFTLPDGTAKKNGDECTVKGTKSKSEAKLFVWPPQSNKNVEPEIRTGADITKTRFTGSGEIFVLAFVPDGTDKIPFPDSAVEALRDPFSGGGGSTTTVPAEGSPSTTAGGSTTDGASSTTAGASSTSAGK